jgi:CheY-like chemotaxis protein/two-component sensor histidine kinase
MQAEREGLLVREREASRLKDEFLAAVSHELRTPLNVIMGWAQVLAASKPPDPTFARAVDSVLRNAQAQNRVIEDLLDVSRIITGKLNLKLEAMDLRSVVDGAIDVIAPAAAAKNIRIEKALPADVCFVNGDPDRLRQVIWNLLSNATKFTVSGGSIRVRVEDSPSGYELTVADSGVGIAPAFLPHVFERFRQADGSTTRAHGGLGLGLAIVKELTELHGGTVRASSEGLGKGATFTVSLPHLDEHAASAPMRTPSAVETPPTLSGVHVLAVDDSPDTLDVLSSALSAAGATVRTALSGGHAVELWRQAPSDIVLCDLAMPNMDGFAVLLKIRGLDAGTGRLTPALALTAYASEESRTRCLQAGFQGHIAKPYDAQELIRAVARAVARQ